MANVHGFRDFANANNGNPIRQPMLQNDNIMAEEIRQNKVPFLNQMQSSKPPLEQTIPYTLKLVWCPTLNVFSFTFFYLLSIWVIYIITLSFGLQNDNQKQLVLAPTNQTLDKFGANNPYKLLEGQVWRYITAAFLHVDIMHIVMNSISILFFMSRLEKCYGPKIMAGLATASAFAGNASSAIFLKNSKVLAISVGASGVIFGVLGGLIAYMIINWKVLGRIRSQLCCIVGLITFILLFSSMGQGVDSAAHLGGLFGGLACGLALFPGIKEKKKQMTIGGAIALVLYSLTVLLIFYL